MKQLASEEHHRTSNGSQGPVGGHRSRKRVASSSMQRLVAFASALLLVILVQHWTHGRRRPESAAALTLTPVTLPAAAPRGAHPRLLLDGPALERRKAAAKKNTPAWENVQYKCNQNA